MIERAFLSLKETKLDFYIESEQKVLELTQKLEISEGKLNLYKSSLEEQEKEKENLKIQLFRAAEGLQLEFQKIELARKSVENEINTRVYFKIFKSKEIKRPIIFIFFQVDQKISAFLKEEANNKQKMLDTIYEQDEKLRRLEEIIASLHRKLSIEEEKLVRKDEIVRRLSIDKMKQSVSPSYFFLKKKLFLEYSLTKFIYFVF
jgi:hypothetical protein